MNKSVEVSAKSIDKAIEDALNQLGASYDEVDVEILQEAGFLKKAKVLVTLKKDEEPKKVEVKEEKKIVKEEKKVEKKIEKKEVKEKPQAVSVKKDVNSDKFKICTDFVKELMELLEIENLKVETNETDRNFEINIDGDNAGKIIGKGGEVMNAIQTIVTTIAIANSAGENRRVVINVGGYKEKRIETLKALAVKKAEKVKETGRYIKLEPMNARERAIIHAAIQGIEGIRTYSTGKDPYRCLCIAPARDEDKKGGE